METGMNPTQTNGWLVFADRSSGQRGVAQIVDEGLRATAGAGRTWPAAIRQRNKRSFIEWRGLEEGGVEISVGGECGCKG